MQWSYDSPTRRYRFFITYNASQNVTYSAFQRIGESCTPGLKFYKFINIELSKNPNKQKTEIVSPHQKLSVSGVWPCLWLFCCIAPSYLVSVHLKAGYNCKMILFEIYSMKFNSYATLFPQNLCTHPGAFLCISGNNVASCQTFATGHCHGCIVIQTITFLNIHEYAYNT